MNSSFWEFDFKKWIFLLWINSKGKFKLIIFYFYALIKKYVYVLLAYLSDYLKMDIYFPVGWISL